MKEVYKERLAWFSFDTLITIRVINRNINDWDIEREAETEQTEGLNKIQETRLKLVIEMYREITTERDRKSWSSGYHTCFVFERSRFLISAPRSAILNEVFRRFLSSSRRISVHYFKIRPLPLSSKSLPIHHSLVTLSFDAI
jgi:hypothetical protein